MHRKFVSHTSLDLTFSPVDATGSWKIAFSSPSATNSIIFIILPRTTRQQQQQHPWREHDLSHRFCNLQANALIVELFLLGAFGHHHHHQPGETFIDYFELFFCLVRWLVGRSDTFHRIFRPPANSSKLWASTSGKVFPFQKEASPSGWWGRCLCLCYVGAR